MAGNDLYLGKMLESMQTKMNSMETALTATQNKMDDVITAIGQGISNVSIVPDISSSATVFNIGNAAKSTSATTYVEMLNVMCLCTGKAHFNAIMTGNYQNWQFEFGYSIDSTVGDNIVTMISGLSGGPSYAVSVNLPVVSGKILRLWIKSWGANLTLAENATLSYLINDVINEGAFAV